MARSKSGAASPGNIILRAQRRREARHMALVRPEGDDRAAGVRIPRHLAALKRPDQKERRKRSRSTSTRSSPPRPARWWPRRLWRSLRSPTNPSRSKRGELFLYLAPCRHCPCLPDGHRVRLLALSNFEPRHCHIDVDRWHSATIAGVARSCNDRNGRIASVFRPTLCATSSP